MAVISASRLSKTYTGLFGRNPQEALRGVDLNVEAGTAFGLVGPNGAGKTTFIKTMLGIVRPTRGDIRILGETPDSTAARRRIGYLPERLDLPPFLTPPAFLASVARLKKLTVAHAQIDDLLVRVGLGHDRDRKIGGFSKGMRQRLGLAAALLGQPDLLILDEPTDGVDPLGRVEIRDLLAAELRRGCTVFLNSHLLAETERICHRVGILAEGRILLEGPLETLCRAEDRWRVALAGGDAAAVERAGFTARPDGAFVFEGSIEKVNAALDGVRAAGALLQELRPDDRDLEEVLAAALRHKPKQEAS